MRTSVGMFGKDLRKEKRAVKTLKGNENVLKEHSRRTGRGFPSRGSNVNLMDLTHLSYS